ncbi:hypothetical protein KDJ56_12140 [Brevibacillus composti]|uniref:Uncharacterized protein n=1 Tax=Brevibacillus composti TaxID=2796470 RepID=A0A7T5EHN2_9BACL|nr:hypothetical protein [Brevibacillus composti]QQE72717.1 hypothetical protein JD108_12195 [Brevibacillus composti]QUO39795.1 hypothetical protein KDJ56_12140 [Brevibacillus composti]
MYLKPKQLWWLPTIFLVLFTLGALIGQLHNRLDIQEASVISPAQREEADRQMIASLLDQLTGDRERAFSVLMKEHVLSGTYKGEQFHLNGDISGHSFELVREDEQVQVKIDGEPQDHQGLPYSLYTPHQHATILKTKLKHITLLPVTDGSGQGWQGYRLTVPAQEITDLLGLWLGPSFSIQDLTPRLAKQIAVEYQLWYDGPTRELRQLEVYLQMETSAGLKRDQLRFQL